MNLYCLFTLFHLIKECPILIFFSWNQDRLETLLVPWLIIKYWCQCFAMLFATYISKIQISIFWTKFIQLWLAIGLRICSLKDSLFLYKYHTKVKQPEFIARGITTTQLLRIGNLHTSMIDTDGELEFPLETKLPAFILKMRRKLGKMHPPFVLHFII